MDYYQARAEDFRQRNSGRVAPAYYQRYGAKYARRFMQKVRPQLSAEGQRWLDAVFVGLQVEFERYVARDPVGFSELERHAPELRAWAFKTHARTYVDAGLGHLRAADALRILCTLDLGDLFTREGLAQICDAGVRLLAARQRPPAWRSQGPVWDRFLARRHDARRGRAVAPQNVLFPSLDHRCMGKT